MGSRATMARATLLTPYPCRKHAAGPGTGAGLWILCRCRAPGRESGFVFIFVSLPFPFSLPFAPHPALFFFFSFSRNYSGTRGPSLDCTIVPRYPAYVVTGTRVRPCTRPFCSPSCIVEAWTHDPLSRILQVIKPALEGITTLSQGCFSCDSQNEVVEGVNLVWVVWSASSLV